jgi:hypothetical protein
VPADIRRKQFRGAKIDDLRVFVEGLLENALKNYEGTDDPQQRFFSHGQIEICKFIHSEIVRVFYEQQRKVKNRLSGDPEKERRYRMKF